MSASDRSNVSRRALLKGGVLATMGLTVGGTVFTSGGFELGAGIAINPSSPESDAARLRATDGGGP